MDEERPHLEDRLVQFAEFLEKPEIATHHQSIQTHIADARAKLTGE